MLITQALAETFKSFFQQDDYGKSVEDAITTNLEEKGKAFDDRVRACLHTRIQNIHKGVVGVGQDVQSIGKSVEDLSKDVGSIKATALMNFEKQKLGMERLEELLSGIAHEAECKYKHSSPTSLYSYTYML
ncbi:hypothetical protein EIK77_000089 [Talaromyces pinophilus]|jgi:hypothetical protein|nr:hypothetical protein EIK77_000089 [Talaromyces pinophilus]